MARIIILILISCLMINLWLYEVSAEQLNITRENGQYIVMVEGKLSITEIPSHSKFKVFWTILESRDGELFKLNRPGDFSFWDNFAGEKIIVSGALRRRELYQNKLIRVIEVTKIEVTKREE